MLENERVKRLIKDVFVFLSITVLSFGKINSLSPFSYAFFYGAVVGSGSLAVGTVALVLSAFFDGIGYLEFIMVTVSALPFCFDIAYCKISKKQLPRFLRYVFCAVNFIAVSISSVSFVHPIHIVINAVITICFSYVFFLSVAMLDSVEKAVSSDTALGILAFVFVAYGAGFSGIRIFSTPLLFLVAGFCIPLISKVASKGHGVVCALALGCGFAVCYYDVQYIALFGFCALCCVLFSSAHRVFPVLASLMGITVFELYFAVDYLNLPYHLLFYAVGGTFFLFFPQKILSEVNKQRNEITGSLALRYLINKNRVETANGLRNLQEIFSQMSSALSVLKGDTEKVSLRLAQKTEEDVCKKCERYKECGGKQLGSALLTLARLTLIKNKATITSLPPLLEKDCVRLASLVGASYNNSLAIRKEVMRIATQNQVKSTLSSSLKDIGEIISSNEKRVRSPLGFDYAREEKIREELALCGIICKQVYLSLGQEFEVTVLAKSRNYTQTTLTNTVSAVLKIPVIIKSEDDSVIRGWKVITLIEKPVFTLVGGVYSASKHGQCSGDTHSLIKLSDYLIMSALCDGMGSGERAEKTSDSALSLIESFYRAGFSHDVAIKSINTFLRLDGEENFSALDVMVFDRREGRADIVKLATPPTYIKKPTHTVRVDASSLPLGIVGEITPSVTSRKVEEDDCFIFVSDGVSDCFEDDGLSAFINNSSSRNPSLLAKQIVEEAKKRREIQADDMTALVCKVIIDV